MSCVAVQGRLEVTALFIFRHNSTSSAKRHTNVARIFSVVSTPLVAAKYHKGAQNSKFCGLPES